MSSIEITELSAKGSAGAGSSESPDPATGLLAPLTIAEFLETYFERSVLHLKDRPRNLFENYLTRHDVEGLLWQLESHLDDYANVLVAGTATPRCAGSVATGRCEWIRQQYRDGGTIWLRDTGRVHRPAAVLQRALEEWIGGIFSVDAFLTPPNARGFGCHFDPNDVIIAQVEGSKTWRLAEGPIELPLQAQWRAVDDDSRCSFREVTLRPGDTLYVPRGILHSTETGDEGSFHLAMAHDASRWIQVLSAALQLAAEDDVALRRSFANGSPDADGRSPVSRLIAVLQTIEHGGPLLSEAASWIEASRVAKLRPLPPQSMLEDEAPTRDLTTGDRVAKRPGQICHVRCLEDRAAIVFPGLDASRTRAIDGPRAIAPALRFIADRDGSFRVSDLPDSLAGESKLVLIRRLMAEGLIQRAAESTTGL